MSDLPIELVLNVLHFCSPDDILSLGQVSHGFRRICSDPYLFRTGIIAKNGNGAAHMHLVGQPLLPSAVAFLRNIDLGALRISLICDLFHASSFSSNIIQFLRNHAIQEIEMLFLDDELGILEDLSFSTIVQSIFAAISSACKRVSFNAHVGRTLRTLPTPCHPNVSPLRPCRRLTSKLQLMESVTEFRLSSVFSRGYPLWGMLSHFLQNSSIEVVFLDCDTTEESQRILQSMTIPGLEMLSIITRGHTLPIFPNSFNKLHPKLKFLSTLNLRSWNTPDSLQLPSVHLSLPALLHLTISQASRSRKLWDYLD